MDTRRSGREMQDGIVHVSFCLSHDIGRVFIYFFFFFFWREVGSIDKPTGKTEESLPLTRW